MPQRCVTVLPDAPCRHSRPSLRPHVCSRVPLRPRSLSVAKRRQKDRRPASHSLGCPLLTSWTSQDKAPPLPAGRPKLPRAAGPQPGHHSRASRSLPPQSQAKASALPGPSKTASASEPGCLPPPQLGQAPLQSRTQLSGTSPCRVAQTSQQTLQSTAPSTSAALRSLAPLQAWPRMLASHPQLLMCRLCAPLELLQAAAGRLQSTARRTTRVPEAVS